MQILRAFALLAMLVTLTEATFLSVRMYTDPECTMDFMPAGVGATDSYLHWTELPASSVLSDTISVGHGMCVNNPMAGVASGRYVCQIQTDSDVSYSRVEVTEYNTANCQPDFHSTGNTTALINYYAMVSTTDGSNCLAATYLNKDLSEGVRLSAIIQCSTSSTPGKNAGTDSATLSTSSLLVLGAAIAFVALLL